MPRVSNWTWSLPKFHADGEEDFTAENLIKQIDALD
jgi:hypothetical protein